MQIKSVLKPENSIIAGLAVAGSVFVLYQMDLGPVSQVHMTEANHPALESSRKKAAYSSYLFVSALSLIAKDANIAILGFASIIAMEIHYRHAIMANPATGKMEVPNPSAYQPAENVVQFPDSSSNDSDYAYGS